MLTGVPSGLDKGARVGSAREKGDFTSPGAPDLYEQPCCTCQGRCQAAEYLPWVFFSLRFLTPTLTVHWLVQVGDWWASTNRKYGRNETHPVIRGFCLSLLFEKLQLHLQSSCSSGGLLGEMNWWAEGWTPVCWESDGLVLRSHWHSAVQGAAPSLIFHLLVQLQVKTQRIALQAIFW